MKILVAIKQVAGHDSALEIDASGRWIEESELSWEINEPDAYALEAALQLKDREGGEVIALSVGPARAGQALREALAKGADRAVHVEVDHAASLDSLGVARLLAAAAGLEQPDLILTGLQSDDRGSGAAGVMLAELLGLPHLTLVVQVERTGAGLRVKRELESGWYQLAETPLPALLTIQSGLGRLRYATLMGIKKARSRQVRRLTAAELEVDLSPGLVVERVFRPERAKQTLILPGDARQAAAALVEKLRFEARAL